MHPSGFDARLFTEVFVTLLVIMDPIGTVPLFLALTNGRNPRARRRLAWQAVVVALVPLGTPLLAGPGAIVATIVFVRRAHGAPDAWAIVAGIVAVHAVLYVALRFSGVILRVIRDGGVTLVTRISGLLLSAIAIQLVADSAMAFARST